MSITDEIQTIFEKAACLYSYDEVQNALSKMANEINKTLKDTNPIIMCVMTGGIVTTGQLLTQLHFPLELDYVHATRYRGKTMGDDLEWIRKPGKSLQDRTILLIDDILDGGITFAEIVQYCHDQGAK